ncbi:MAG: LPS export ABC transporter periplasmic protein LptC [Omnitrophica bacterium]|nr:LPS export ABC transporter periplasmic protein LptC [Candidatus Omnitrophota bacterium]
MINILKSRKALFVLAFLIAAQVAGCAKKESVSEARRDRQNISQEELLEVNQEVYSFRLEGFNKNNEVQWGLEGGSASVALRKVNINDLKAVYYGEDMTFTIFADKAVYDKETQDIELEANIIGKTSDGGELTTTSAKWNAKTERIETDAYVTVKRDNISCRGKGMITRPRLKRVQFREEIEVVILPDRIITCDGPFEINHDENKAIFHNNVKITDKDSDTFTDKLTVYLDPETNQIERIVTEGNVRVVHTGGVEDIGKMTF